MKMLFESVVLTRPLVLGNTDTNTNKKQAKLKCATMLLFTRLAFCLRAVGLSKSLRGIRACAVPTGRHGLPAPLLAGGGASQQGRRRCTQARADPSWPRARTQLGKIERLKAAVEEVGGTETEKEKETEMENGY